MLTIFDDCCFREETTGRDRISGEAAVVTIGNFDGVHLGHRELIREADGLSKELGQKTGSRPVRRLITFSPHPMVKFGDRNFRLIYTDEEKQELIDETGWIDEMIVLSFTDEIMHLSPEDFYRRILRKRYCASGVVVGRNFTFGEGGKGSSAMLRGFCEKDGIPCLVVDDVKLGSETVSSTGIRRDLLEGNAERAAEALGRPYFVEGIVRPGKHLGRKLETPTVNVFFAEEQLIPRKGVYVSRVCLGDQSWQSVSNVGVNPTFGGEAIRSETFIFDFSGNLYDRKIRVEFLKYIRPEQRFESAEALQERLKTDIAITRSWFGSH